MVKHGLFYGPTNNFELLKLMNNLWDEKFPGAYDIEPKTIEKSAAGIAQVDKLSTYIINFYLLAVCLMN